ncbi:glycosyltransferase family 87 protein [Aliirhizobium smilacinae]|uniref:DUF2029 domain-containing protein n=1 Tax=Aliirhizobium smilacinae TaxID=1395944 RepID=A0A5C4XBC3_9HYPH|nr:glycosyltransferase family 87 protein [Rhizobium smilacinae]TNM60622.1 DUF2029 domain-containing protein [Rhizobium smilacinae]
MQASDSRFLIWVGAAAVWFVGALIGLNYLRLGWTLDQNGLSVMTGRLPYWDFTNLWGGGRMALEGQVDYLFSPDLYRAALRSILTPRMLDQEWSYPPSMLLVGLPLALLPILPAYLIWNAATLGFLYLVAGWLELKRWQRLAVLLSPPVLISILLGQNGALTASLLIGGLFLSPSRPLLAGVFFGLLTLKPHLGILVPFCLLAAGNYRAIGSAALTTLAIVVATGSLFGWDVWTSFFTVTNPLMRAIMEAPYPQGYHMNAMTFFAMARSFGAGLTVAYGIQILVALVAIGLAVWLWRQKDPADHRIRVAVTGLLALCATPYGYTYDAVPLALAIAILGSRRMLPISLLAIGWLYPLLNHVIAKDYFSLGALVPAAIASVAIWNLRSSRISGDETPTGKGVKAS